MYWFLIFVFVIGYLGIVLGCIISLSLFLGFVKTSLPRLSKNFFSITTRPRSSSLTERFLSTSFVIFLVFLCYLNWIESRITGILHIWGHFSELSCPFFPCNSMLVTPCLGTPCQAEQHFMECTQYLKCN